MKLTPPKTITWVIALIVGVLGIIGQLAGFFGGFAFWLVVIGFVILVLSTLLKDLQFRHYPGVTR
ncbi:MAG TPA: hypothetical protein PKK59_05085 [Anaerolineaceae bacterium]|nr:hypothetical protein [Anaerolineaceae bacterium]